MKNALLKTVLAAVLVAGSITTAAVMTAPAYADVAASKAKVDAAKAKGVVGEKNDGYIGFVSGGGDAALKAAVDEINAGRREVYGQAAAKNGVSVDAAAQAAFVKVILAKVNAGEYYQDAGGAWVKK
ncbi:YdbL family protein [Asticcacaulis sp. 201]|uniref:YdbL family protein n=1 Tax=Asticcacaulis sp. 201 TaxID=3028787 RepID=UPI00291643A2|nr:YdbL family protein [Asticcacaulis sp. 201]MDV6332444.1 YdbL family protein [Asticcacaulis sp. 201]